MRERFKCEMPSSTIDGQSRIDCIRQNLLSTVAAVSGWKQFSWVGCSTVSIPVWSTMRADPLHSSGAKRRHRCWKSFASHLFCFIPAVSSWVSQVAIWNEWFQSGRAQWARVRCTLGKEERGQPTILCTQTVISHKDDPSERESERCCMSHRTDFFFFIFGFDLFSPLFIDLVFPCRAWALHRADAMTLVVLRKCRDTQWPQEAETQKVHRVENTDTARRTPAFWMIVEMFMKSKREKQKHGIKSALRARTAGLNEERLTCSVYRKASWERWKLSDVLTFPKLCIKALHFKTNKALT